MTSWKRDRHTVTATILCLWAKCLTISMASEALFTLLCMETCRYKMCICLSLECNALTATRCCRQQNAPESINTPCVCHKCHVWVRVTSVTNVLPECPDACDIRPLEAGEQLRSIRTIAAVHSVMMTGLPLRLILNIFFSAPGHSSPRRLWSLRCLWPNLRPRLSRDPAPVSSPELLSSSSDKVSLPRLFLDLKKYLTMKNILPV